MKYFTKDWFELMQNVHYTQGFELIEDKEFTEQDIKMLYNKKLNEWIQDEKEVYDSELDYTDYYEIVEKKEFNPKDWLFVDEKARQVLEPKNKQEVIDHLKQEEKQAMKKFNKRKPFDESKSKKDFDDFYKHSLQTYVIMPQWVYEKIDKRLIALGYLTESVFNKLEQQEKANKEKFDNIIKQATDVLEKQQVKEDIAANFNFHDDILKSIKCKDGNCIMKLMHSDFIEDYTVTVVFKEAEILEMETLKFRDSIYLYDEIYSIDTGYEVHMLFECDGLKYLTIKCSDIEFKYS